MSPVARWVDAVVTGREGVCLLVVLIGRPGRRGTELDGLLNQVPAAAEQGLWLTRGAVRVPGPSGPAGGRWTCTFRGRCRRT